MAGREDRSVLPEGWRDESFCYLSTTGRRSGRTHTVEIWFAADGDTLYLLAGGGERSDWVANLRAEPSVAVRVAGQVWRAEARVVTDAGEARRAATLVHAKYQPGYGGDLSGWRDTALPVAVALTAPSRPVAP